MGSRSTVIFQWLCVFGLLVVLSSRAAYAGDKVPPTGTLRVSPTTITLDNPEGTQQVLVSLATAARPGPAILDLTRAATYEIRDSKIAAVDRTGLVQPKAEGQTVLVV